MSLTCITDTLVAVVSPHGLPHLLLLLSVLDATVDWLAKCFHRPPRKNVLEFKRQAGRWSVAGTTA